MDNNIINIQTKFHKRERLTNSLSRLLCKIVALKEALNRIPDKSLSIELVNYTNSIELRILSKLEEIDEGYM